MTEEVKFEELPLAQQSALQWKADARIRQIQRAEDQKTTIVDSDGAPFPVGTESFRNTMINGYLSQGQEEIDRIEAEYRQHLKLPPNSPRVDALDVTPDEAPPSVFRGGR